MQKFMTLLTIVGATLTPASLRAATFSDACSDIAACAKVTGELLNQKYIFDTDVKGKVQATSNLELTKDNAEWLFTNMLYLNGFTRVPQGVPQTFVIQRVRDAKDSAIPLFEATQSKPADLPNGWDYATLRYKATYPDVVDEISRMTRNFMPPNSRIISDPVSGTLLVTDALPNLKKMYDIIKGLDHKMTLAQKRQREEERSRRHVEHMQHPHEDGPASAPKPDTRPPSH